MTSSSTVGICQVYEGASILITGGSGTVGKILLEKILRSCPGVERIYVLIRNRRNQLAAERLEQMLETELFSKLSEVFPNFRTKCVAVTGNTRLPKLGISEEDEERLVKDVNFVFNLAANIRLDNAKLSVMIADNVTSLRKLITLCTKMKKLKALVNASTTFCHNDKGHIEEIVYPCSTSPSNIITLAETLDSEYLEMIKGGLIGRTSNEYLFTKTLAETLLATEGRSLPVCMVRIPLVAATMQDPFPGWIDGIGGIVGFVLAVGTGVMRNGILDPAYVTEALPADMVVSCLIAAGWATAVSPTEECTVYNMVSASDNRAPPAAILGPLIVEYTRKTPFSKFFREPSLTNTRNKAYIFMSDIWNMLQAYAMDILMGNIRNNARSIVYHRRRILQLYRNMRDKTPIHLSYDSSNVICLWGRLSNAERQVFNFDRKLIDWPKYLEVHCLGVKRHVMKDDMSKVEEARLYLKRWCLFWTVIQMAVVASILLLLYIWVM